MIKRLIKKLGWVYGIHSPVIFEGVVKVRADEDGMIEERLRVRKYWDGTWELV